jgi:hypothetical protein
MLSSCRAETTGAICRAFGFQDGLKFLLVAGLAFRL